MKLFIRLRPNSKHNKIKKVDKFTFKVWVVEPAKEGQANEALINQLSNYFNIAKSRIVIKVGLKSKTKVLEIL